MKQFLRAVLGPLLNCQSIGRRRQYQYLAKLGPTLGTVFCLDLGGVREADYHQFLGAPQSQFVVWNLSPKTKPDALVNLDAVESLPTWPSQAQGIIALNVLEHLYDPISILNWGAQNIPKGGFFIIVTPFHYPFHPSPQDYWRMTTQFYEKFFASLGEKNITGDLQVDALGSDLRDLAAPFTTDLIFGSPFKRILGNSIEFFFYALSGLLTLLGMGKIIESQAKKHAPAIAVFWRKH